MSTCHFDARSNSPSHLPLSHRLRNFLVSRRQVFSNLHLGFASKKFMGNFHQKTHQCRCHHVFPFRTSFRPLFKGMKLVGKRLSPLRGVALGGVPLCFHDLDFQRFLRHRTENKHTQTLPSITSRCRKQITHYHVVKKDVWFTSCLHQTSVNVGFKLKVIEGGPLPAINGVICTPINGLNEWVPVVTPRPKKWSYFTRPYENNWFSRAHLAAMYF